MSRSRELFNLVGTYVYIQRGAPARYSVCKYDDFSWYFTRSRIQITDDNHQLLAVGQNTLLESHLVINHLKRSFYYYRLLR